MRTAIVCSLAAFLLPLLPPGALAKKHAYKPYRHYDKPYDRYSHATERQRRNSIAFDNGGEYYESDYTAHAFGSRSWWMLQQGRGGGRR